jgi:hypothetical protein
MSPDLRATLLKVGIPLLCILLPVVVARLRGISFRELGGFYKPPARLFVLFIGLWIVWMIVTELLLHWLQMGDPKPWPPYPMLIVALRILAIGILGPIAEELLFRGMLYSRLSPRIGAAATIILLAVVWSVIHIRYEWSTIALICVDGLIFGYARHRTGSVYTPMAMHMLGNLYSIYQSLS